MDGKVYTKKIVFEVEITSIFAKVALDSRAEEIVGALEGLIPLIENTEAIGTKTKIFISKANEIKE